MPGPERTLMRLAYSERTHNPSRANGRLVGDDVSVGSRVEVSVWVGVRVTVALGETVGLKVGVLVSVAIVAVAIMGVIVGCSVGVEVDIVAGGVIKLETIARRSRIPMAIGIP